MLAVSTGIGSVKRTVTDATLELTRNYQAAYDQDDTNPPASGHDAKAQLNR